MKNLVVLLLIALAAAYYFGYEPSDFIPSFSAKSTPPPKVRRAPAPAQVAVTEAPRAGGTTVIAQGPDGSLEHRWIPSAASSQPKP